MERGRRGYVLSILPSEWLSIGDTVGLELLAVGSEALQGSRVSRPPTMVRTRGAGFCAGV